MKQYCGQRRDDGSVNVVVRDAPLAGGRFSHSTGPTLALSPAAGLTAGGGFDWGTGNAAAMSLARAILADCLGADAADDLCAEFEWSILRGLPDDAWELGEGAVRAFTELVPGLRLARALETRSWPAEAPAPAFNPFDSSTWSVPVDPVRGRDAAVSRDAYDRLA